MNQIDAMKQALEALESIEWYGAGSCWVLDDAAMEKAEHELRTAIAEAEKQEPVAHSVVAGALFDFMGWLTSRDERLMLSGANEAGPAVKAITEFAEMRDLNLQNAQVQHWQAMLTTPPAAQHQPLTRQQLIDIELSLRIYTDGDGYDLSLHDFARAIEAAHGIGEPT